MNRSEWVNNAAIILMSIAPLYDYETAKTDMDTYLTADAVGWVANGGEPVDGEGAPSSGETPSEAAGALYAAQVGETVSVSVSIPVTLDLTVSGRYAAGVTAATIKTNLQTDIEARVDDLARHGISVSDIDFDNTVQSFLRSTGELDETARQAVQTHIQTATEITDPVAKAVVHVRSMFSLDNTWMAFRHYINTASSPSIIFIKKYLTVSYTTADETFVDGSDTVTYEGYLVYINRETLNVQTVITSPTQVRTPTP